MSITTQTSKDGTILTIKVVGRFDFKIHSDFRKGYESQATRAVHYIVDLSEVAYLDSSALGMLLLLKQHAGGDQASITLAGVRSEVAKILNVACFDKLFKVA